MTSRYLIRAFVTIFLATFGSVSKLESRQVLVGIPGFSQLVPFAVAKEKGYYREEGLQVDFILMRPGLITQSLAAGNVEFVTLGGTAVGSILSGFPFRIVFTGFGSFMSSLYARPEIREVKGLKGKRLGTPSIGTASYMLMREILQKHGLEVHKDVAILATGGSPETYIALQRGGFDGAVLAPPYTFLAADRLGYREFVNFARENLAETMGNLVVREETLRSDPDLVERMSRAALKGLIYARENRAGAVTVIARSMKMEMDIAGRFYDESFRPASTSSGILREEEQTETMERWAKSIGKQILPASQVFDYRPTKKVHGELVASRWAP